MSLEAVYQAVLDGDAGAATEQVTAALEAGVPASEILNKACIAAMTEVGRLFEEGEKFVPEMLISARAMQTAMGLLKPLLLAADIKTVGTVVVGTVAGDLHDIGKNLVGIMLRGAGFEVIDLGINVEADKYLAALEEHQPNILGMSALLTTTMPYMKVVIDTMKERGIRDDYIVMVGGAPLNEEFGAAIGADAYCRDAATAVETAKELIRKAS